MTFRLTTPPAALALSLDDAKEALKIDTNDQDAMVQAWVAGIVAHAEHYTGRAFINQGWRLTLDAFPCAFELAHPPIVTVATIKYIDVNGAQQTMNSTDYLVDIASEPGRVVPAYGKAWPATRAQLGAVEVNYTAGYGATDTATPDGIKLYLIAKLREQYDPAIKAEQGTVQSSYLDRILDRFMVYA